MGRSKDNERNTAHNMYVFQGKCAKEISLVIKVTEKTVGNWITKGGWKAEREAEHNTGPKRIENIKRVIGNLTEKRLSVESEARAAEAKGDKADKLLLDAQAASMALEVAYWNKALTGLDKSTRISLEIYLEVMESIFSDLKKYNSDLYLSTIDFQQLHVETISLKIG